MPSVMATRTGRDGVGQDVAEDDAQRAGPDRLRPDHELALPQGQELRAHEPGHAHPAGEPDHGHDGPDRGLEEREHGQQQEEAREDQHQVDQPHDDRVDRCRRGSRRRRRAGCRSAPRCPPTRSPPPARCASRRACARARRGRADRCRASGCVEGGVRIFFVSGRLGSHGASSGRQHREGHQHQPPRRRRTARAGCGRTCARTGASPRARARGRHVSASAAARRSGCAGPRGRR